MSLQECSLNITKPSKCAPSVVSNPRDEISRFVMGSPKDLVGECRLAILHYHIDIYRCMVHSQQFEETRLKRMNR